MKAAQRDSIDSTVLQDTNWKTLYLVAALALFVTCVLIVVQMTVYAIAPPPNTVTGIFEMFEKNAFTALIDMDILYVADNVASLLVLCAMCVILGKRDPALVTLGAVLAFVGIVMIFVANPAIEMMTLSGRYAAASSDAAKSAYLSAGEALYAQYTGTAYNLHLILGTAGFILLSYVMLSSKLFYKATAIMGITGNALSLGYLVPGIGMYLLLLSVLFLLAWNVLLGINLMTLWRIQSLRR